MTDKWKEKYLELLDQEELREKEFEARSETLRRGLVRVSLVADGIDPQMDDELASLRKILRNKKSQNEELEQQLDLIDGDLQRLDQAKQQALSQGQTSLQQLAEPLIRLPLDSGSKKSIKNFKSKAPSQAEKLIQLPALIAQFSQLQKAALMAAGESDEEGNWFSKWFNRNEAQSDGSAESGGPGGSGEGLEISGKEQQSPVDAVAQNMMATLSNLIVRINIPEEHQDLAAQLVKDLAAPVKWESLDTLLARVAELILLVVNEEHDDFEHYLNDLNESLSQLNEMVDAAQGLHGQEESNHGQMYQTVQKGLDRLTDHVEDEHEIGQLKMKVRGRLSEIQKAIAHFTKEQTEVESQLKAEMDRMGETISTLEEKNAKAIADIEAQKAKAQTDPLTELPNREAWNQRLKQEVDRFKRYGEPLVLAVADVDFFKRVNDSYGHLAGDKVLKVLAQQLQTNLRTTDFLARYGGEEFVVLLPNTDEQSARKALDKVRMAIEGCPFHFKGEPVQITMSFGMAPFVKEKTSAEVFSDADAALYRAKEEGRNQIQSASAA